MHRQPAAQRVNRIPIRKWAPLVAVTTITFRWYQTPKVLPFTEQLSQPVTPVVASHLRGQGFPRKWQTLKIDCHLVGGDSPSMDFFINTSLYPSFIMNIHKNSQADYVSASIKTKGCFECELVPRVQAALLRFSDAFLLDVGGGIGIYSLAAAASGREAFAIEPSFANYRRICLSVSRNKGFGELVHVLPFMATERPLRFAVESSGQSITDHESSPYPNVEHTIHKIQIDEIGLPLDRPVVLKVNAEGQEMEALMGAKDFICNAHVILVTMQIYGESLDRRIQEAGEIFDCLTSKGLVPYVVKKTPELRLDPNNLVEWVSLSLGTFIHVMWYPEDEVDNATKEQPE